MNCEDWEVELDYEVDEYIGGLIRNLGTTCVKCGSVVIGEKCEKCGTIAKIEKYYDPDFEEYEKQMEKEYKDLMKKENWVEVKESDLA